MIHIAYKEYLIFHQTHVLIPRKHQGLYFTSVRKVLFLASAILQALMSPKYVFWLIIIQLVYPLLLAKYIYVEKTGLMELVFFWPLILVNFLLLAVLLWIGLELYRKNSGG